MELWAKGRGRCNSEPDGRAANCPTSQWRMMLSHSATMCYSRADNDVVAIDLLRLGAVRRDPAHLLREGVVDGDGLRLLAARHDRAHHLLHARLLFRVTGGHSITISIGILLLFLTHVFYTYMMRQILK